MKSNKIEEKILITSTPTHEDNYIINCIGDLSIGSNGVLSVYDGNSFINSNNTSYNWQNNILMNQIYFQERVKDLYFLYI